MTTGNKRGNSCKENKDVGLTGPSCSHVKKGTNSNLDISAVNSDGNPCQDCKEEGEKSAIWMCLQCGHRGCGQNSEKKHAVTHYHDTPLAGLHCLAVSTEDWTSVWCYICAKPLTMTIIKQASSDHKSKSAKVGTTKVGNNTGENKSNVKKNIFFGLPFNGQKKLNVQLQRSGPAEGSGGGSVSVKGLSNIGNTCFFNAVIQNLSQTQMLRQILRKVTVEKTNVHITPGASSDLEPIAVQLGQPGSLTLSMCQLLDEIQESRRNVVTPQGLFTQVCKKAGKFKGFQQQDSQELLRYLLDGMRAEETKRLRSGILEALNKTGNTKLLRMYEKNGCPRNFVDEVFGGEMTSTIMCRECNTATMITETFLDLSLPVSDEAHRKTQQKSPAVTNGDWSKQKKVKKQRLKPKHEEKITCDNRYAALSEDQDGGIPETDEEAEGLADEMDKMFLNEAVERDVPAEPIEQRTVVNQDPELAFRTLATRTTPAKQESSVQSCLFRFTEVENLTQTNRLLCATCTERHADTNDSHGSKEKKVYTDSFKQILISAPPPVLTLHLKRHTQQVGSGVCKVNKHVEFPQTLDLAPFCAAKCKNVPERVRRVLYSLYGMVDHRGSMKAGHYTASVKARPQRPTPSSNGATTTHGDADTRTGSWFHVSDTHVQPVSESKVQGSQAYLLFYERI